MRIHKLAVAAALGVASLGLSACATGLDTRVTRYTPAAIPVGQTFYVLPASGPATPQFYRYASMISQQFETRGYRPAGAPQLADMLVRVDYGIDQGTHEVVDDGRFYGPGYGGFGPYGGFGRFGGYDPYWGVYSGRPYFSRWGADPFYYGWNDPYWYARPYGGYGYGSYGYGLRDYTVYKSYLDMSIVQRANNAPLFEGHAKARSQTDNVDVLVPDLIQAMFTGFPGRNGETVKISIPAKRS